MDPSGPLWGVMTIVGPLLLLLVAFWALLRNRKARASKEETEAGTRDLYRAEERAHRHEDDNVP